MRAVIESKTCPLQKQTPMYKVYTYLLFGSLIGLHTPSLPICLNFFLIPIIKVLALFSANFLEVFPQILLNDLKFFEGSFRSRYFVFT